MNQVIIVAVNLYMNQVIIVAVNLSKQNIKLITNSDSQLCFVVMLSLYKQHYLCQEWTMSSH